MNPYKIALLLFAAVISLPVSAEEPADTIRIIENARSVVVVKENGKTRLNAIYTDVDMDETMVYEYEVAVVNPDSVAAADDFPDNWGMELPFMSRPTKQQGHRVSRFFTVVRRALWGWRFNYSGRSHVKNGWEVSIPDVVAMVWRHRGAEFEIGAGFSCNRYLAQDGFQYTRQGDSLTLTEVPDGMKSIHSRLDVFSFQVPVLYNQRICRNFNFTLGAIANLNTYARANTRLETADNHYHDVTFKGLQQNLFTVDAYASFDIAGIGMYARWSPMPVFRSPFGPESKGFTIGVNISLMNM